MNSRLVLLPFPATELLVFCNITNKIRKRTDTAVAFTQEYYRVSYPLRNVTTLSTGSGSSKDTHLCSRDRTKRTSKDLESMLRGRDNFALYFELLISPGLNKPVVPTILLYPITERGGLLGLEQGCDHLLATSQSVKI